MTDSVQRFYDFMMNLCVRYHAERKRRREGSSTANFSGGKVEDKKIEISCLGYPVNPLSWLEFES